MSQSIRKQAVVDLKPQEIYEILLSSEKFSSLTDGAPAVIESADGGAASIFGGMITGRFIELVPGQRIVQAWRVKLWPEGAYSLATFMLEPTAKGTNLTIEHVGFPEEQREHLAEGWQKNYI